MRSDPCSEILISSTSQRFAFRFFLSFASPSRRPHSLWPNQREHKALVVFFFHSFYFSFFLRYCVFFLFLFLKLEAKMKSTEFAEEIRRKINDTRTLPIESYGGALNEAKDGGTSHASFIGPNGDVIVITSTVNF